MKTHGFPSISIIFWSFDAFFGGDDPIPGRQASLPLLHGLRRLLASLPKGLEAAARGLQLRLRDMKGIEFYFL